MKCEPKPKPPAPARFLFRYPLALESETSWYVLFGVVDLVLTTLLLRSGSANESNPLARLALLTGGLRGLIGYKCILVALVTVVTQIVALHRPRLARLILVAGIAVQLLVAAYSTALLLKLLA